MIRLLKKIILALGLLLTGLLAILRPSGTSTRQSRPHSTRKTSRPDDPSQTPSESAGRKPKARRGLLKKAIFALLLLGIVGALGGFLVAASGIIPIKASSGHWAITAWFLNFSMARSVSTHSLTVKHQPPLDDPALILKGAGHYAIGCQPCHGSPGFPQPRVARHMTPHPPFLPPKIKEWDPEELFYIVKHGVKFTGMPGWPARDRDDEVWAVTAFLLQLPGMTPNQYRALAFGEADRPANAAPLEELTGGPATPALAPPAIVTQNCARCHGADGLGRDTGAFPKLAGQHTAYLAAALEAYARGFRHSGIMEPIAAALSTNEMHRIAQYYSALPAPGPTVPEDPRDPLTTGTGSSTEPPEKSAAELLARGRDLALRGIPEKRVPACIECHGPNPTERNPHYPRLAGQYPSYLKLQLELFKKHHRGGSEYQHLMHPTADRLTPEDIHAVALYFASLPPQSDPNQ